MGLVNVVLLVHTVRCLNFGVQLVSFNTDVQLLNNANQGGRKSINLNAQDPQKRTDESVVEVNSGQLEDVEMKAPLKMPTGPATDCIYRYPELKQVDIILSNLMNELTQVSVKANGWLRSSLVSWTQKLQNAADIRVALETRFRVLHQKQRRFFEDTFSNMTRNYRAFYNTKAKQLLRSGCKHQDETKQLWQDLIERSLVTLRSAVGRCVDEYLRDQIIQPNSELGGAVRAYFAQEISHIRSNQLKLLCDKFQLCYDELLKEFRWKTNFLSDSFWSSYIYNGSSHIL